MKCPRCSMSLPTRSDDLRYCLCCNCWYLQKNDKLVLLSQIENSRARIRFGPAVCIDHDYPILTALETVKRIPSHSLSLSPTI